MNNVRLAVALGDYDHVRDLVTGHVTVEGVDLTPLVMSTEEIFQRFFHHREWEVSEFSLAKYVALIGAGDDSMVGLPIFPSRVFRHGSAYVRADSELTRFEDLRGRRVGIPEWAQTAAVYARGALTHTHGVALSEVSWVQAGVNEAGRREKVPIAYPAGVRCEQIVDRSLSDMLVAGDIDAVLSARPPSPFGTVSAPIRRLIPDAPTAERDYFAATGIFPIMHVLVVRHDDYEANPWIAQNLVKAFEQAKQRSLARLRDTTCSRVPLPWIGTWFESATATFGADPFPYGIEANRTTLTAFLGFCQEQGLTPRRLDPEELFPTSTAHTVRI